MKPNKLSRSEIINEIENIFLKNPSRENIKKAKKLASSKNIKLTDYKKKFCKKCLTYFTPENYQIRIKNNMKIIKCKSCNNISRYKIK